MKCAGQHFIILSEIYSAKKSIRKTIFHIQDLDKK